MMPAPASDDPTTIGVIPFNHNHWSSYFGKMNEGAKSLTELSDYYNSWLKTSSIDDIKSFIKLNPHASLLLSEDQGNDPTGSFRLIHSLFIKEDKLYGLCGNNTKTSYPMEVQLHKDVCKSNTPKITIDWNLKENSQDSSSSANKENSSPERNTISRPMTKTTQHIRKSGRSQNLNPSKSTLNSFFFVHPVLLSYLLPVEHSQPIKEIQTAMDSFVEDCWQTEDSLDTNLTGIKETHKLIVDFFFLSEYIFFYGSYLRRIYNESLAGSILLASLPTEYSTKLLTQGPTDSLEKDKENNSVTDLIDHINNVPPTSESHPGDSHPKLVLTTGINSILPTPYTKSI
jgi:hypothetical protein